MIRNYALLGYTQQIFETNTKKNIHAFSTHRKTRAYPWFSSSRKVHDLAASQIMAVAFACFMVILCVAWNDGQHQPVCNFFRLQTHADTDKLALNRLRIGQLRISHLTAPTVGESYQEHPPRAFKGLSTWLWADNESCLLLAEGG